MPSDPNGNFSLDPVYVAVPGTTIRPIQHNTPLEDIQQGLSARLMVDGRKPMSGDLDMGGNDIINLASLPGLGGLTMTGAINFAAAVPVASSATTDLTMVNSNLVNITGTNTITSLGVAGNGVVRLVVFSGALTLTHNATSLILPGAANIATAPGDTALFVSEGGGNWRCSMYQPTNWIPKPVSDAISAASNLTVSTKTASYTVLPADKSAIIYGNSATAITFTLPTLANVTEGDQYRFRNIGDGFVTLDGAGTELIEAAQTFVLTPGKGCTITKVGSGWQFVGSRPERLYESAPRAIVNGDGFTLTHGLGAKPTRVDLWLVCTAGTSGYVVGDELLIGYNLAANNDSRMMAVVPSAATIFIRYPHAQGYIPNKATSIPEAMSLGGWNFFVRASIP